MQPWHYALIAALAAAAAIALEVAPPAYGHWHVLGREVAERTQFSRDEMPDLARKYPSFMGPIVTETVERVQRGTVAPVLERAWATNSLVCTVRAAAAWVANNFIVRILSPTSIWEHVSLVAGLVLLGIAVIFIGGNIASNMALSRTMMTAMQKRKAVAD